MAIRAHSTAVPGRRLLPLGATAPAPLIQPLDQRDGAPRHSELLAILDAGPIGIEDLAILSRHRRSKALLSIQSLIDILDELDGDPDLEPSFGYLPDGVGTDECESDIDEETLGWPASMSQILLGPNTADGDETAPERHGAGFVRGAPDDYEPWLGAPEISATCRSTCLGEDGRWFSARCDQTTWAKGSNDEREVEDEHGTEIDRGEHDPAECGIADIDGVAEQWGAIAGYAYV